ncbi:CHASE-like protein [Artemisia annua]|uniref:CHASE-like protein n=1 Tax=Artemisia annua TaxID=35608 RepID=A0A2U1NGA1_ARTAN|nr:CHASE-like protein [Artemisia annua]
MDPRVMDLSDAELQKVVFAICLAYVGKLCSWEMVGGDAVQDLPTDDPDPSTGVDRVVVEGGERAEEDDAGGVGLEGEQEVKVDHPPEVNGKKNVFAVNGTTYVKASPLVFGLKEIGALDHCNNIGGMTGYLELLSTAIRDNYRVCVAKKLASKQTIVVNVYDTTNVSATINMYDPHKTDKTDTGLLHISSLDFGDPARRHEMRCSTKCDSVCLRHQSPAINFWTTQMIKDRQAYEIRNGGFGILDRYEEDLNESDSSKRKLDQELDKLEQKVDLLDSIVNELEYDFATWFSEDPDNTRLKDIKAKFNVCIRNIDLYGDVKGKSLVVYDDETGKDKDCIRNVDLCEDDVLIYVHSTKCDSVCLRHQSPAINFRTTQMIKDRQAYEIRNGGFGILDRYEEDLNESDSSKRKCSHLTKESDHEIVKDVNYDKENNDKKGFTVFEVPEIETVAKVKEGITCVQLLEEEMHKVLKKSELEYEKKITFCEDGFMEFGIPEILKEAEQKIPFSPYAKMSNEDEFSDDKKVEPLPFFTSLVVVSKKVTFEKDLDPKMSNKDEFSYDKKVESLPCFTSPVVVSKKVTFEKDLDPKMSNKNQFVDEKKVKSLSFFNRPFVVSSPFPQHSFLDAPSFSLGREFEDEKPVIKEISVRQNPRRDVVVAAHSRSPFKDRQILPNVPIKQSEERVADVLFMMPEETNQLVISSWNKSRGRCYRSMTKHILNVSTDFPEKYDDFEKVLLSDYQAKRIASSENFNLIKMFAKFHSKYNLPSIGFSFERVVAKRIKMGWRIVDNFLDDGVFLMSHMNMFFGESEGKWNYGLLKESKEQTKQLNTLRNNFLKEVPKYSKIDKFTRKLLIEEAIQTRDQRCNLYL